MQIETHETNRKLVAEAISEHIQEPVHYNGLPRCTYSVGPVTVEKDGSITCDDSDVWAMLTPLFANQGWQEQAQSGSEGPMQETEEAPDSEAASPTETRINSRMALCTQQTLENLVRLMYTRQRLINRMFQMENLRIDDEVIRVLDELHFLCVSDLETTLHDLTQRGCISGLYFEAGRVIVTLPFPPEHPDRWQDCVPLIDAIVKQAQTAKHVKTAMITADDNEKYQANAWLNRLGFGGPEHKDLRRRLMAHLSGYAAFRCGDKMQQHKDRLAEQRRIAKEIAHDHE